MNIGERYAKRFRILLETITVESLLYPDVDNLLIDTYKAGLLDRCSGICNLVHRFLELAKQSQSPEIAHESISVVEAVHKSHSMRHTFGTMLHRAGVSPSVAQAAMRHSDIRLTMSTYNHLGMMDVAGAIDSMPLVQGVRSSEATNTKATGTDGKPSVALTVAPAGVFNGQKQSIPDVFTTPDEPMDTIAKRRDSLGKPANFEKRVMGFEPTTFSLGS